MNREEKIKKIEKSLIGIRKEHGNNSVGTLGNVDNSVEMLSTGVTSLNIALSGKAEGGFAKGRIVEIVGEESTSKTTIAIHTIAECQKNGGICAYIDVEHAYDPEYSAALGVDNDSLYFVQPSSMEEALQISYELANGGGFDLIVLDSVAALVPLAELEGEVGQAKMGLIARLMGQGLRKLTPALSKNNVCMIFVNQYRINIGTYAGDPRVSSGGHALKFFASQRIQMSKSLTKDGDVVVGNLVKAKVIKNKVAPPFKSCEFKVNFGTGIDKLEDIINMAISLEIIKRGGAWYTYLDSKFQGMDNLKQFFKDNEEVTTHMQQEIVNLVC